MPVEDKVRDIFVSLFFIDRLKIHDKFSQEDTDSWDSLQHLNLVLALEETFGISISPEEATEMLNFGLIVLLVEEKIKSKSSL